jgi:hypothetical protein
LSLPPSLLLPPLFSLQQLPLSLYLQLQLEYQNLLFRCFGVSNRKYKMMCKSHGCSERLEREKGPASDSETSFFQMDMNNPRGAAQRGAGQLTLLQALGPDWSL